MALAAALAALTAAPPTYAASNQARPAAPTEATAPREAGEPIMAIVSIKSQQVTIYDADGWILRAPVSTGITGRETPAGVFSVVEKDKDHHSNLYDDASMPNMQRLTWSGIALHGGPLPGHAASHGCVRLPYDFAEKIFDETPMGCRMTQSRSRFPIRRCWCRMRRRSQLRPRAPKRLLARQQRPPRWPTRRRAPPP
jgi:lipoprotein-anchoring transpeptidase ErfK/SrfK